jgi:hypothetical protein
MHFYRNAQWKQYREAVILLDNGVCVRCGRGSVDGVVLQVHHKIYYPGRKPWEYPYDACETLCKGCHAAEHGEIPPRYGWDCVGWNDLEDLVGTCENCGTAIRYIFLIQHEKWGTLEVGEICCDNLTCTQAASSHMESIRRLNDRRKRFVSSIRWKVGDDGDLFIKQRRTRLDIVRAGPDFQIRVNGIQGRLTFQSALDAKMKVFDLIESGVLTHYLKDRTTQRL